MLMFKSPPATPKRLYLLKFKVLKALKVQFYSWAVYTLSCGPFLQCSGILDFETTTTLFCCFTPPTNKVLKSSSALLGVTLPAGISKRNNENGGGGINSHLWWSGLVGWCNISQLLQMKVETKLKTENSLKIRILRGSNADPWSKQATKSPQNWYIYFQLCF